MEIQHAGDHMLTTGDHLLNTGNHIAEQQPTSFVHGHPTMHHLTEQKVSDPAPICGGGTGGLNIDFNGSHIDQNGHTEQVNINYSNSHVSVGGTVSTTHDWAGNSAFNSVGGKINICF
jgi:hypothetical protein